MSRAERILAGAIVLVGLLVAAWLGVQWYGHAQYQAGHAAAVNARAAADALAVLRRTEDNAALAQHQGAINLKITEAKHEELAPVRERIVVKRVRVGAAICGPAASAETESTGGGDGADSGGRLVRSDVERDLKALTLQVEEALATGRACQAFVRENGLAP